MVRVVMMKQVRPVEWNEDDYDDDADGMKQEVDAYRKERFVILRVYNRSIRARREL